MKFQRPTIKDLTKLYKQDKDEFIQTILEGGFTTLQPKYDGRWGILKCDGTHTTLHTRHGKLWRQWLTPHLPSFEVHGEHLFGTAWAKNHVEYEALIAFDIVMFGGKPVENPQAKLELLVEISKFEINLKVRPCEVANLDLMRPKASFDALFKEWVYDREMEGVMLRSESTTDLIRIKPIYEMDYVILGFRQSESKRYRNRMVRSVTGGLYKQGKLVEVCHVSGLNDEQRRSFFLNPEEFIGKVFTASGKGIFSSGALRHPNFVRLHPEKLPEECVYVG